VLQYVIAGLVLGGIYAIASAGLVVTYLSAGVLNFSFGALAYFIARFYYYLNTQHHWNIAEAAIVSVVLAGPLLGVFLYVVLFRLLRLSSTLIKVVVTLGLSVTVAPLATLMFGNVTILQAPGLAPQPVHVYHLNGVPVTLDQIIVYACVILVVLIGGVVLRYTDVGLRVRAMVDSPALTSLSGTNPTRVSIGVWAVSIFLAGLSGVLSAPIIGLAPGDYTLLMAAAFAAVIAAKLRNIPVAVVVALLMGVAGALISHYLPPSSSLTAAVIPSIPFAVTAIFLVYHMVRTGRVSESEGVGGALDRAIAVQGLDRVTSGSPDSRKLDNKRQAWTPSLIGFGLVCVLPFLLHGFWIGLLAAGVAYGVLFLSFTLVTGEGGMVWLCMVTFGGVGALTAAQLATVHGWPVLAAVVAGGVVALPMGILVGLLTIRLGDLYVALVTLTFGLLMENLVFSRNKFLNEGIGVSLNPPAFAHSERVLTYVGLVVFAIVAAFIVNLRRSTTGMALTAVRWSEPGSKTIGVSVLQMKVVVAGLAAFVAGIGGALLAVTQNVALPANYATLAGIVWFAVLVTIGVRSNTAALIAGLTFTLIPGLVLAYLPTWFGQVPPILFGLGAIAVAQNPDGTLATQARQIRSLSSRIRTRRAGSVPPPSPDAPGGKLAPGGSPVVPTPVPTPSTVAR
jgi:branched-chain amino acid transport system permease protein